MTQGKEINSADRFEFVGGYKLKTLRLYTDKEKMIDDKNGYDISNIVNNISIEESLTSYALKATFTILDGVNLIEELKLNGNERILLEITKNDITQRNTSIKILFYATEYPLYGKSATKTHQAFKIVATTEHGYLNRLLSISKNIKGTPADLIRKILINELKVEANKLDISNSTKGLYSYNAPSKRPFECIRDILKMTADVQDTPIFLYETLSKVTLKSYADMVKQDKFLKRIYKYGSMTKTKGAGIRNPNDVERFREEAQTILQLSSNLRFSQIEQTENGAFVSTIENYDLTTKTFTSNPKVVKQIETISKDSGYSKDFKVDDKEIKDYTSASIKTFYTQSKGSIGQLDHHLMDHSLKKEAVLARQENITHNLTLHGDLELCSGSIIEIEVYSTVTDTNTITKKDEYLSGKYLVTSVTHNFSQVYTTDIKISKDGF